jgi:hypothetical protein
MTRQCRQLNGGEQVVESVFARQRCSAGTLAEGLAPDRAVAL